MVAVDVAAGTSSDVSAEIARKVELAAVIEQRTPQTFVEATPKCEAPHFYRRRLTSHQYEERFV